MNDSFFSIIMPVYNTYPPYLREAVESVFDLDYNGYEFVIVDDGTNRTETLDVLKEYEDRCTIIHQENSGISASRLKALSIAKGEYIFFLDSDDHIDKDALNVLNGIIREHHPDVIISEPPRYLEDYRKIEYRNKFFEEGSVSKDTVIRELCRLHINGIGDKYVKRELYQNMSGFIDTSFINGEDLQQSTYIILNADSFYYSEFPLQYYRYNLQQREYYDATDLNDINFPVPAYRMLFEQHHEYEEFLPVFKQAVMNSIIYNAFKICKVSSAHKEKADVLDRLNELEIVKILSGIKARVSPVSSFLYYVLTHRYYRFLTLLATIYHKIFGLSNLY
ncbi:MAG: glycosyltransferase family 2 protein [Erysipelotrichaceae bacterium]|nr:glycosyltransferase family 2 protein [Erysipelotrichaceae bacterium]